VTALRVVTWNVRAAIGPGEFPGTWWRRPDAGRLASIADVLGGLEADLVALQECAVLTVDGVRHDTASELAARLGLDHRFAATRHFAISEDDGRVSGAGLFGNALFSRAPIVSSRTVALPMAPVDAFVEPSGADDPLAGVRYTDAPEGVREARCLLAANVSELAIGVTHLSHVGSAERALQAAKVDAALGTEPVILAGDLNAAIESDELTVLRSGWTDAFAAAGVAPGDPRRVSTEDGARIDHVLVRGLEVTACRRVEEAGWLSDHLPVLAELRPRPANPLP
jgi:endonuclease/exonuclease/phosphatase family metal-dependent hydrolase